MRLSNRWVGVITLAGLVGLSALTACGSVSNNPDAQSDVTLTVTHSGTGGGTVTSSPAGVNCGAGCTLTGTSGTVVTLTATPDASSTFTGWNGGGCTGTGPCTITLAADVSVDAAFAPIKFTLAVTPTGNGTGTVSSAPAGINCGSDCTELYNTGTAVTLTATPDSGATFVGWTGGGCSGTGTCVVTTTADTVVQAAFALNNSIIVTLGGNGTGTVSSAPAGINCGSDCSEAYAPATMVTLTASATGDSSFTGWSGGGCSGTGTCVITVTAAIGVTATFTLNMHSVTVTKAGNGAGVVMSNPAGINCGATCSAMFDSGTAVTLMAVPVTGSVFTGWAGGGCSGTGTCAVTTSANVAVTATFTLSQHVLTVTNSGTGAGVVTSNVGGINCGSTCMATIDYGTLVTLTATPLVGSTFSGWSGGGCTGTGSCMTTITAATSVDAMFTITQRALTTVRAGTGSGSIASVPGGIACGVDCTENYDYGTVVTLSATPATGATFAGWSGGGCGGTGTCVVTMTAATTVTATFTLNQYLLTVTKSGNGAGTVISNIGGINCGTTCAATLTYGSMVTLTATPSTGSTFSGWSGGGCSGTGTCVVTLAAVTTVDATFTLNQYALTVTRAGSGAGNGTVNSAPGGIACGAMCTANFNYNTSVVLTASVVGSSVFQGWSGGGCSGTGTCTVAMTAATAVTATFVGSITFGINGTSQNGSLQTFTIPSGVTSVRITANGARGCPSTLLNPFGAQMAGTFAVSAGQVLTILVGQQPVSYGGGGGTYVVRAGTLLMASGGGGCAAVSSTISQPEVEGRIVTSGGTAGSTARSDFGNGGNVVAGSNSGAGGGYSTNGAGTSAAKSYLNGGQGGTGEPGVFGGYGGGGARTGLYGQGAGGGYSGGSCGDNPATSLWAGCGGGGSFNAGAAQANTAGANNGEGSVTITY